MNRPLVTAKKVSRSGRVKHTRLRSQPPRIHLDRETLHRLRRGFISLKDIGATYDSINWEGIE